MTYQELFNQLAELEEHLFYASAHYDGMNRTIELMHDCVNKALIAWHEYTGDALSSNDTRILEED